MGWNPKLTWLRSRRGSCVRAQPVPIPIPDEHWDGLPGTEAEERVAGKVSYLIVLDRLHRELNPSHYLEIGIRHGRSLALARGRATGVDPARQ